MPLYEYMCRPAPPEEAHPFEVLQAMALVRAGSVSGAWHRERGAFDDAARTAGREVRG